MDEGDVIRAPPLSPHTAWPELSLHRLPQRGGGGGGEEGGRRGWWGGGGFGWVRYGGVGVEGGGVGGEEGGLGGLGMVG